MKLVFSVVLINLVVLTYQIIEVTGGNSKAVGFLFGCAVVYISTLLNALIFSITKKSVAYSILLVVFKFAFVLLVLWALFSKKYLDSTLVSDSIKQLDIKWFVVGLIFSILTLGILAKGVLSKNNQEKSIRLGLK